jgi:predicted type IV restriction endonuclease
MYCGDGARGWRILAAPMIIAEPEERFDRYQDTYKSHKYNEAQVRQESVDPFFKALGRDLENARGFAEAYKEVIHEDSIKVGYRGNGNRLSEAKALAEAL